MLDETIKVMKTISVPVDLAMFKIISKIAKSEKIPNTIIVRRALDKCYRPNEDLLES